jgi:6-phosphogluconolactonase
VPIYSRLAVIGHDLPWELARITFGDERCLPPDDRQSNFRMARETLLGPAAVPEKSILRMRGEIDPQVAAQKIRINSTFWPRSGVNRFTAMI